MSNIVKIKFIRHSHSTANEYYEKYGMPPDDPWYKNAKLTSKGIDMVIQNKEKLLTALNNPDIILTSPLKRTVQTALLLYDKFNGKEINLVPLVSETGEHVENKGAGLESLFNDAEVSKMPNFESVKFNDYYNAGWNENRIIKQDLWNDDIKFNDINYRIKEFKKLMSDNRFTNKSVVIFSHRDLIYNLLGYNISNLDIISFTFNQDNGEINNVKITEVVDRNKYIKYSK